MATTAEQLAEAAREHREARERRDALICQRRAEGVAFRVIAAEVGVCHRTVQDIVAGRSTAR